MGESKKTTEKKSVTKIKATVGAWWKSTVIDVSEEAPEEEERKLEPGSKTSQVKATKKATGTKEKQAATKKTTAASKKKAETAAQKKTDGVVEEAVASDDDAAPPQKKRSRRPRRSSKKSASPTKEAVDAMEETISDGDGNDAEAGEETMPASAKPKGRSRKTSQEKLEDNKEAAKNEVADETEMLSEEIAESQEETASPKEKVVLRLLINAEEPEECRLALLENGRLESIHVSTITRTQTRNNIYKGRVVAIEPSLQAAFVDYGTEKNGFLPFSEIHPEYYAQDLPEEIQRHVDSHHWKKLSITDVLEKGQEVLVQVVKEEVGKKGANMTTYLSLPGRSVVLMPGSDSSGISRKISGEERRDQLRKIMNAQNIPEGVGWIVRTAGADITKTALSRDVSYLLSLWQEIKSKGQNLEGVGQVYEDHQSVQRFLRENFDPKIEEILVDDQEALEQVQQFIARLPSKQQKVKVRLHKGARPIFNQYSIEDQIESIYQPKVNLPSGGSIVIDPTEALVAIDVNSGSTSKGQNFEESIFQANIEAASELARQLRLRDLGGLIVVDFIDMRNKKHIREVERELKRAMKRDKAKVDFSRISKFGLMQISRQKLGAPIEAGNYKVCACCKGRGVVRSVETLALFYLRRIQTGASRKQVQQVECRFPLDVAEYLLNKKRSEIQEHESRYDTEIRIIPDITMRPVDHEIILIKAEKDAKGKKQG